MRETSDIVCRSNLRVVHKNTLANIIERKRRCITGTPVPQSRKLRKDIIMNNTDVRVRKMTKEGKMKAVVSITIDDEFVVHDIKVVEGDKGLFIAMPSRKAADGEYRDIAHPINSGTRNNIQKIVLEAYEKTLLEPEAE